MNRDGSPAVAVPVCRSRTLQARWVLWSSSCPQLSSTCHPEWGKGFSLKHFLSQCTLQRIWGKKALIW